MLVRTESPVDIIGTKVMKLKSLELNSSTKEQESSCFMVFLLLFSDMSYLGCLRNYQYLILMVSDCINTSKMRLSLSLLLVSRSCSRTVILHLSRSNAVQSNYKTSMVENNFVVSFCITSGSIHTR